MTTKPEQIGSWRRAEYEGRRIQVHVYHGSARTLEKLMKIRRQSKTDVVRDALAMLDAHHHDLRLAKSRGKKDV